MAHKPVLMGQARAQATAGAVMHTQHPAALSSINHQAGPQILSAVCPQVTSALDEHSSRIKPLFFALINAVSLMLAVVVVLGLMLWFVWNKYLRRGATGGRTIAIKDGRV